MSNIESRLSKLPTNIGSDYPIKWLRIEADEDIENNVEVWTVSYTNTDIYESDESLAKALDKLYKRLLSQTEYRIPG